MKSANRILLALALCIMPLALHADSILGQSGTVEYDFPNVGNTYDGPVAFTVTGAPTVIYLNQDFGAPGLVQNTITGSGIDVTFTNSATWSGAAFNGEVYSFPGLNITSVTAGGNYAADTVVTFDSSHIYLNWQGSSFTPSDVLTLTVNGGSPIPEPSSMLLIGSGLMAGAGALRRKLSI